VLVDTVFACPALLDAREEAHRCPTDISQAGSVEFQATGTSSALVLNLVWLNSSLICTKRQPRRIADNNSTVIGPVHDARLDNQA
jgi:hypothetical protein